MLKLEVGKMYETKSGNKAIITHRMPPNPFTDEEDGYPMRGYMEGLVGEMSWKENGTYLSDSGSESDIIREHVPPPTADELLERLRKLFPTGSINTELNQILADADRLAAEKAKVGK